MQQTKKCIIFKKNKSPLQSVNNYNNMWFLQVLQNKLSDLQINPTTGWNQSYGANQRIILKFETCEEAIQYAKKHDFEVDLIERGKKDVTVAKRYCDNFTL